METLYCHPELVSGSLILNLSPVAPREATMRSDSRDSRLIYIGTERDAEIILKSIQHRIQHDRKRRAQPRCPRGVRNDTIWPEKNYLCARVGFVVNLF